MNAYIGMVRKIIIASSLMICLASSVVGQFAITGKVIEKESGESLPYATVSIKNTTVGTNTNLDGFFTLYNVPSDTTTLQVSYVGYDVLKIKLSKETINSLIIIELEPLSTNLEEVVVSADAYKVLKANSGVSTSTLSTKQLALLPSIGEVDIFRSLQLLPGISSTNQSSAGLYVRGGTPEQNLVLLDGITVYKVDHFFGFFSAFNANAVKDVKIYKGAYPAKYGGRVSSVVDMKLKTGSFQKSSASAGFNLFAFNAQAETPIGKNVAIMFAGRRSFNEVINSGLFRDLRDNLFGDNEFSNVEESNNVIIKEVNPDFNFYDVNTKVSYRPTEMDLITFSYYGGKDFLDESRDLNATIPVGTDETENRLLTIDILSSTDWGNNGTSIKWSRQCNSKVYTNLIGARSKYFSKYNRDASLALTIPELDSTIVGGSLKTLEDNKVRDHSFRFDLEWKPNAKHTIESGLVYINTNIDYLNIRDDSIKVLERREEAVYAAAYISDSWVLSDKLTITPGVRLASYDFSDQTVVSPRFSALYQFSDRVKLKLAYGKFYQYVNRIINENLSEGSRDFWLLADNDLVPVSRARHYVVGVSYETKGWLFDVESYYKRLKGLSEFTLRFRTAGTLDPEQLFLAGKGEAKGLEFLIQKKSGQYTGWLAYTLGNVRNTFDGFNDGKPFPALHDQLHEVKVVQSVDVDDWTLSTVFIYGSGKAFSEPSGQYSVELLDGRTLNYIGVGDKNGSRLKAYSRFDVSAHNKFTRGNAEYDLGFSIFNVFNRRNTSYFQYDFQQNPSVITEITYLGITPNISLNVKF
ncbi:MAG: TonB-dependent receptor [Cytophagales bacterium]|nr:TonB-dependent receptor [Cytophagales bacterium]